MRILYVDIDTLRADHLGCYGYRRSTSPAIDRIAAEGVRFDQYYCTDAPCLPSRTALVTGRFGIHTGVVNHGGTNADVRIEGASRSFKDRLFSDSLAGFLRREARVRTVTISPFAERHSSWSFYAGFTEVVNTGRSGQESGEEVTPPALDWIERNAKSDNWFLHVNYWDPHTPYRAPEEFGNPFEDEPPPAWLTAEKLARHREMPGPHCARELAMYSNETDRRHPRALGEIATMDDWKRHIDGYDCGIAFADRQVGALMDALERQGVLDDLVVIVSSDHGENQGELGIYAEHATADSVTCRIPMIVRWPGRALAGHVDSGLHYNLDLLPTLAGMLGVPEDRIPRRWDGASYAKALTEGADCGRDFLVVSQCAHVCQRSVRFGPWLWMRTWHDGFHLFPAEMLFNVEDDPHLETDLAAERADICGEAARRYLDWHSDMMATSPSDVDPMWTVIREGGPLHARGKLRAYCEYLEKTGRAAAIPELRRRHPCEFA